MKQNLVARRDLLTALPVFAIGGLLAACQTATSPVTIPVSVPPPSQALDIRLIFNGVLTAHNSIKDQIPPSLKEVVENRIAVVKSLDLTNPVKIRAFLVAVSAVVAILTKLPLPPQVMIVLIAVQILLPLVQAGLGMAVDNQTTSAMSPEAARNLLKSL